MTNQPVAKLNDGLITATIWKNEAENGNTQFAVTFARSYLKDDEWHTANSFSGSELLRLARLAEAAYGEVHSLKHPEAKKRKAA